MHSSIRPAAVAGLFYPRESGQLTQLLQEYLRQASVPEGSVRPRAIVTPHAGYVYSGSTAAVAWASASPWAEQIQRVLLLGPAHRVALRGIATSPAAAWQTPLGAVALDQRGARQLQELPFVVESALAHAEEHSLEVQVPFIQTLYPQAELLPLVVGDASPEEVAELLRPYWQDPHTLIAISTDLSHYHDYATAQQLDGSTALAIEQRRWSVIGPEQACGCRALNGLLQLAGDEGRPVQTLALCNSGDTAGDKRRVVGYGAFVVH